MQRMDDRRNGVVIGAVKSGSGKTLITCALIQALKERGLKVCSYKCGPDYIDPMFHRKVLGIPGGNLDTFFTGEEKTKEIFLDSTDIDSFAVVEGVMGLFDGMGGIHEEGSSYHLAKTLKLPVILIIDAHGMGRSIIPLIAGFMSYDKSHQIAGVILNRVSKSYFPTISKLIWDELHIEVLGYFPKQNDIKLESRHLGLKMPDEISDLRKQIQKAAGELENSVDIDRIIEAAEKWNLGSKENAIHDKDILKTTVKNSDKTVEDSKETFEVTKAYEDKPVLAVARDEAFCFYYQENIKLLEKAGFCIKEFSPVHDKKLPDGSSAILLGGGYPELFAKKLSDNEEMKKSIKAAIESGMPSVAECGGFMYLHKRLTDEENKSYDMVGILDEECRYQGKLVRFGYASFNEKKSIFLSQNTDIKGHEFHYYDSTDNGNSCIAKKPVGQRSWECVWEDDNHWWGFPHLYYPSNPSFVEHFYKKALEYKVKEKCE